MTREVELTDDLISQLKKWGFAWTELVGNIYCLTDLGRVRIIPGAPLPANHWNCHEVDNWPPIMIVESVGWRFRCTFKRPYTENPNKTEKEKWHLPDAQNPESNQHLGQTITAILA